MSLGNNRPSLSITRPADFSRAAVVGGKRLMQARTRRGAAAVAALAAVLVAAAAARAQNPEKFERVVPAKPSAAVPSGGMPPGLPAHAQEAVRKAQANAAEGGVCARFAWADTWESRHAHFDQAAPGAVRLGRTTVAFDGSERCSVEQFGSVFQRDGRRCVVARIWGCKVGGDCGTGMNRYCKDPSGNYQLLIR